MTFKTDLTKGEGAPAAVPRASVMQRFAALPEITALAVILIALCLYFWLKSPYFLSADNFLNILSATSRVGIIAAPMTLLVVAGHIDLSVGSALTFCGVVMATVAQDHGIFLGILATLAAGAAIGVVNGFLVTVIGLNSLITTLGTLAAFAGLARVLAEGKTIPVRNFGGLGLDRPFLNIPLPVIIFAVVLVLFAFLMGRTVFGRSMYAIGANPLAARLSGIRSARLIFVCFILSGVFVGLAALINVSVLSAASTLAGNGLELSVVTAVILGGSSLAGGRGRISGTLVGLLIIGVLNNGLTLLNIDSFWQDVARGVLLILAVSMDRLREHFSAA